MNRSFSPTLFNTAVIAVDLQTRLLPVISGAEKLRRNLVILLTGANTLKLPVIATEQYPKGLGHTEEQFLQYLNPEIIFSKTSFSCFDAPDFASKITAEGIKEIIVCGVETHVCVQMTVLDALARGLKVYLIGDAVGSRCDCNHHTAVNLMQNAGAIVTSTESLLFSLIRDSTHPDFKSLSALIK